MQACQLSFPAFAASRAASLCPPAGAAQAAKDAVALVAQPSASGQRVDTRPPVPYFTGATHLQAWYQFSSGFSCDDAGSIDAPDLLPSGGVCVTGLGKPYPAWLSQHSFRG